MNNKITKYTKITGWKVREPVDALGDISGMAADPEIKTVIGGRHAICREWFDEATGNGFCETEITLHDFEAAA